jgi:hypothetical protein
MFGMSKHSINEPSDGLLTAATPFQCQANSNHWYVSIELEYSPQPEKIVEWVEEACRETAKLMELVALRK